MKKILSFAIAFVMLFSLIGCGSGDSEVAESNSKNTELNVVNDGNDGNEESESVEETKYKTMAFGYITMNVPYVFSDTAETEGMYISSGPDASIVVTPTYEMDIEPSEWDASLAAEALELYYGTTYTDLELAAFEGDINMNGNQAVYYAFYGNNAEGKSRLVHVIRIYNAELTAQYVVTLLHSTDDEFFTEDVNSEIINTITLSQEAQNLVAKP